MKLAEIKKLSINTMIVGLIGAAAIAVIAVLAGGFNDTLSRALFTLLVVALHALASLGFLESRDKLREADQLKFSSNVVFIVLVLSFLTSVFGIWELIPGDIVAKLYGTYSIAVFATFHAEVLSKAATINKLVGNLVLANYLFMMFVIVLLLPLIWFSDGDFTDFYYRGLSAVAIVDATLTILVVILHKLHLDKNPKTDSQIFSSTTYIVRKDNSGNIVEEKVAATAPKRRMHPLLLVLIIFLALQFIVPILFMLLFSFS